MRRIHALSCALFGVLVAASARARGAGETGAEPPRFTVPTVFVHIATPGVELVTKPATRGGVPWVCPAPCDGPLPIGLEYRIEGPGMRPTEWSSLRAGERVDIQVTPRSSARATGGTALIVAGGIGAMVGFVALVTAAFSPGWTCGDSNGTSCPSHTGTYAGVGVAEALSLTAIVSGVLLIATSGQSEATQLVKPYPPEPTKPRLESSQRSNPSSLVLFRF